MNLYNLYGLKKDKMKNLLIYILLISAIGILFFPFLNNSTTHTSYSYSTNYFEYIKGISENIIYLMRYPYLETIDLIIIFLLPISILFEIISFHFKKHKLTYVLISLCLLSSIYFIYFNQSQLKYGIYILVIQQLALSSFLIFYSKKSNCGTF
jgi:hypothetical protein